MNAIIGFTRMLSAADFSDEEKEDFLGIIVDNGEQLMSMLDDVIDISKVETGQVEVHRSFCKLNGLLEELYAEFAGVKEKQTNQSIDLVVVKGNENPNFAIYIDATLLREIYMHLIDNAIKFTDHGEVHFGYYLKENCAIRFFVKDTGMGIPDHQKEKIFLRFYKLNEPGGRIYRGAGLGLSIAQNYVQKLGGQLSVDSEEGEGSCFSFVLKMERVEGALRIV
jgi:signal transduction histidine kinase